MKILVTSDTHNRHLDFQKMFPFPMDCDMIIHAGDITSTGYLQEAKMFLDWFSSLYQFEHKIFIAGNHDYIFETDPNLAKALIPDNVIYLQDSGIEIEGIKFWGSPVSPFFNNWAFNRLRGEEIKKHWDLIPDDTDVLITHCPPYGILDYAPFSGEYAGCQDLFVELGRIRPKYHLFGHIHPSYGIWKTETCTFINASAVAGRHYYVNNAPFIIEI